MTLLKALCINQKVTLRWDCENYICQEVTKMGSKLLATEYRHWKHRNWPYKGV